MTTEICKNYMFYSSACEIWEDLATAYSMRHDISTWYELESKIFGARQGTLSISEYYGKLKGLWIELDQYQNLKLENNKDAITLAQFVERSRMFKFLSGLNPEYDLVRAQILGKERLPSLSEVFFIVRGEEARQMVMMNEASTEGVAMFSGKTTKPGNSNLANIKFSLKGKEERWCSHCKKSCHTKDTCFKLHGKEKALNCLAELKGQPSRKVYQASSDSENLDKTPSSSTEEGMPTLRAEIERLKTLMESISKPPFGTCSLTMTGKNSNSSFNFSRTLCKDSWVLDSSATDHMTPHSSLLTSFVTLSDDHITIANGTHIPIHGRGNVSYFAIS